MLSFIRITVLPRGNLDVSSIVPLDSFQRNVNKLFNSVRDASKPLLSSSFLSKMYPSITHAGLRP